MARAKSNRGQSWSVRYYLCSGDQIAWRIPNTLLKDLAAGKLALPQFAGTKQKVLEAFVGRARGAPGFVRRSWQLLLSCFGRIARCSSGG